MGRYFVALVSCFRRSTGGLPRIAFFAHAVRNRICKVQRAAGPADRPSQAFAILHCNHGGCAQPVTGPPIDQVWPNGSTNCP